MLPTWAQAADVDEDRRVRASPAHARPHRIAAVSRVKLLSVHSPLPHVERRRLTPIPRQLLLSETCQGRGFDTRADLFFLFVRFSGQLRSRVAVPTERSVSPPGLVSAPGLVLFRAPVQPFLPAVDVHVNIMSTVRVMARMRVGKSRCGSSWIATERQTAMHEENVN